jgi:hypothetical protein
LYMVASSPSLPTLTLNQNPNVWVFPIPSENRTLYTTLIST